MLEKLSANIESAMCKSIFAAFCLFFSAVFIFVGLIIFVAHVATIPTQPVAVGIFLTIIFTRAIYALLKGE